MRSFFVKIVIFQLVPCIVLLLNFAGIAQAESAVQGPPQTGAKTRAVAEKNSEATKEKADKANKVSAGEESEDDSDKKSSENKKADAESKNADKDDDKSEKKSNKSEKEAEKKPKPYKVKRDELKVEVNLDGIFVADEMQEVLLRPEVWSSFKVLEAVEHGTSVKKGDVLIRFDAEKLEEKLADEALDQRIDELALLQAEEEFPRLKRLAELSYESAKRSHERMEHDYKYYHEIDRPIMLRIAKYRFKSSGEKLATAEEELKQLQQMYDADELTEETEEIVLRRQRFAVETAKLSHELAQESLDYALNVSIPRTDEYYETAKEQAELAYQQAKTGQDLGATRRNFEMEKKRHTRAENVEKNGKLLSDKSLMVIRAPADGVAYYGQCIDGKWSQVGSLTSKFKKFGTVSPNSVLMTIVKPGPMHVESNLTEKQLTDFETGMTAKIIPTANSDVKLKGKVAKLDSIPGAGNKFHIRLSVDTSTAPAWLVAGMTCDAKVLTYNNKEALVIPQDMVQTDEDDEDIKYVMLLDPEEDKPVRREVELGRKQGKEVEVLKGLDEDDRIVKEEKEDDEEE